MAKKIDKVIKWGEASAIRITVDVDSYWAAVYIAGFGGSLESLEPKEAIKIGEALAEAGREAQEQFDLVKEAKAEKEKA